MKINILIIIPARGGSKGIPRKNLRNLNGKPLIFYAINTSRQLLNFNIDVYVSTEDDEISLISKKFNSKVVKRSSDIANDKATLDPVIFEAYNEIIIDTSKEYEAVITLQPTSPLLNPETLENAINYFFKNNVDTLISGVEDTHLTWIQDGETFVPNYKARLNRQELPKTFKETGGFVITKPEFIKVNSRFGNKIEIYPISKKESIDIDDFDDWNLCEYYLKRNIILFIVAGNSEIGLGHVYNTLSIANEILNHRIIFLVLKDNELAYDKISEFNYEVHLQQSLSLTDEIFKIGPSIVINDILDTKSDYIKRLKQNNIKCINFEDLGSGAEEADLVINAMYPENKILLNHYYGVKYFVLRDEFLYTSNKKNNKIVQNVLISFGGVDPNNYTERVLSILLKKSVELINITVITGLGYKKLNHLRLKYPNITIKSNVVDISDEMLKSDVVFTSAGRTTFEVASIGVPCIVLCQNEREATHFFASEKNGFYNLGLGYKIEDRKILEAFEAVKDIRLRDLMQKRMFKNNIKNGKDRVLNLIKTII